MHAYDKVSLRSYHYTERNVTFCRNVGQLCYIHAVLARLAKTRDLYAPLCIVGQGTDQPCREPLIRDAMYTVVLDCVTSINCFAALGSFSNTAQVKD
jgi:hypothetical protein